MPSFQRSIAPRYDLQNYNYNTANPTLYPSSKISSTTLRLTSDGPSPRAETPSGLDYGHIGAYKLGSLRITNGAASPCPSDIPTSPGGDEDYVSASEGRASPQNTQRDTSELGKGGPIDLDIDSEKTSSNSTLQEKHDIKIPGLEKHAPRTPSLGPLCMNTHLPPQEFSTFKFTDSPSRSLDLANEYIRDIAGGPFSLEDSPPVSPKLETTSKHTAVEDDLFEPEPLTPGKGTFRLHNSFDSGYHGVDTTLTAKNCGPEDLELKLLAKSDSGYSSNFSLRSFKSNPTMVPAKEARPRAKAAVSIPAKLNETSASPKELRSPSTSIASASSTVSNTSAVPYLTIRPKGPARSIPKGAESAKLQSRQRPPVSFKYNPTHNSREPVSLPPSKKLPNQASVSQLNSPSELKSLGLIPNLNATSRWRSGSRSRARQTPQPVFTIQASPSPSEQLKIPPVPREVSRRLKQRVDHFPSTCFPNTWPEDPTLTTATSDESLHGIFGDESVGFGDDLAPESNQSAMQEYLTQVPVLNRRSSYGVSVPSSEISRKSFHQYSPPASRDETWGLQKTYYGSDIQGNASNIVPPQPEVRFERGRTVSREAQSLHILERSIPRRYPSLDIRPRCPSCGPPPQVHEWFGQRPYSVISDHGQHPRKSPGAKQKHSSSSERVRQKSLPPLPVSMRTQERMHASHLALHAVIPPVMTVPFPATEGQLHNSAPVQQQVTGDPWSNRKSFWARRKSIDSQQHPKSARPSMEFHRPQPQIMNRKLSSETRPQEARHDSEVFDSRSNGVQQEESYDHAFGPAKWRQEEEIYDHSHGTYYYNKESKLPFFAQHEVDYYTNGGNSFQQHLPETIHWRGTPTSNLLVPESYTGDLSYGYEPGVGIGGEGGAWNMGLSKPKARRRSIRESHAWSVAKNAMPVFLQKVKIRP